MEFHKSGDIGRFIMGCLAAITRNQKQVNPQCSRESTQRAQKIDGEWLVFVLLALFYG